MNQSQKKHFSLKSKFLLDRMIVLRFTIILISILVMYYPYKVQYEWIKDVNLLFCGVHFSTFPGFQPETLCFQRSTAHVNDQQCVSAG